MAAKAKRELVWILTPIFMGWGCNRCWWKGQALKNIPIKTGPSAETRGAFERHNCREDASLTLTNAQPSR
jgi:hypothetical protein